MSPNNPSWREHVNDAFGLPQALKPLQVWGFPKTAEALSKIVEELKQMEAPPDMEWRGERALSLASAFAEEFGEKSPVTRDFRRDCIQEVTATFLKCAGIQMTLAKENLEKMNAVKENFIPRIYKVKDSLDPVFDCAKKMLEDVSKNTDDTKLTMTVVFHMIAYMYLVMVEGVLDDLARLFYFFKVVSEKKQVHSISELKEKTLKIITTTDVNRLTPLPIFLHNWDARVHVRNAIAHGDAQYDPEKNTIHFIDWNQLAQREEYNEVVTMDDFLTGSMEFWDTLEAFTLGSDLATLVYVLLYLGGTKDQT